MLNEEQKDLKVLWTLQKLIILQSILVYWYRTLLCEI